MARKEIVIDISGFAGVVSINSLVGAVTLSAGAGITLNQVGNDIEISAASMGSVSIGDVIGASTAPAVLFIGAGDVLAQDPSNFGYNPNVNFFATLNGTNGAKSQIAEDLTQITNSYRAETLANSVNGKLTAVVGSFAPGGPITNLTSGETGILLSIIGANFVFQPVTGTGADWQAGDNIQGATVGDTATILSAAFIPGATGATSVIGQGNTGSLPSADNYIYIDGADNTNSIRLFHKNLINETANNGSNTLQHNLDATNGTYSDSATNGTYSFGRDLSLGTGSMGETASNGLAGLVRTMDAVTSTITDSVTSGFDVYNRKIDLTNQVILDEINLGSGATGTRNLVLTPGNENIFDSIGDGTATSSHSMSGAIANPNQLLRSGDGTGLSQVSIDGLNYVTTISASDGGTKSATAGVAAQTARFSAVGISGTTTATALADADNQISSINITDSGTGATGNILVQLGNVQTIADDGTDSSKMTQTPTDFTFDEQVKLTKTITPGGTTGDRTINTQTGSVNFAALATTLTVTNSLVDANSVILVTVATNDATMKSVVTTQTAGSFTIIPATAPTAETRVNFVVYN